MVNVMSRHWRKLMLVLMAWIWPLAGLANTITLNAIDQDPQTKSWKVHIASHDPVKIHRFALTNPDRLVIDITGGGNFQNRLTALDLEATPVKKIRSSSPSPQFLRIVLDLNTGAPFNSLLIALRTGVSKNPSIDKPVAVTKIKRPREIIVVIDPGHGGKDPGATGLKKIQEKTVVLNIAKKLQQLIDHQPGFKAILTRNDDYYLTLRERLAIARKNKADMFIAIHADAYPDPLAHGVSVFALSQRGATSEAARWLAARENQSELMGGVDLGDKEDMLRSVLINLSQTATIQASLLIGQNLLEHIQPFAHLHHHHMEQAAFVVLKSPDIPSLLVETGFLSNFHEEEKLRSANYQYDLANAMMLGIKKYFLQRPPPGTWLAAQDSRFKNTG
jgi:N-acetylmuramoyl-L-alanine amidase